MELTLLFKTVQDFFFAFFPALTLFRARRYTDSSVLDGPSWRCIQGLSGNTVQQSNDFAVLDMVGRLNALPETCSLNRHGDRASRRGVIVEKEFGPDWIDVHVMPTVATKRSRHRRA